MFVFVPTFLASWIGAFLQDRRQRVRVINSDYVTAWLPVRGGVPQEIRVGPVVSLLMINDLLGHRRCSKYVDDIMPWETCRVSCEDSVIQDIADDATVWSANNKMQLNADKTKETIVSFVRNAPKPPSVTMGGKVLERISSAKILGVIVSMQ